MRIYISLLIVILAEPAEAHCYSIWHYKTPQHCGRGEIGRHMGLKIPQRYAMRVQVPPPAPEDNTWFVEITREPDEVERDKAVDKLKEIMK